MSAIAPPQAPTNPSIEEMDQLSIGETITIESGPVSVTGTVQDVYDLGDLKKVLIETPDATYEYRVSDYVSRLVEQ